MSTGIEKFFRWRTVGITRAKPGMPMRKESGMSRWGRRMLSLSLAADVDEILPAREREEAFAMLAIEDNRVLALILIVWERV